MEQCHRRDTSAAAERRPPTCVGHTSTQATRAMGRKEDAVLPLHRSARPAQPLPKADVQRNRTRRRSGADETAAQAV